MSHRARKRFGQNFLHDPQVIDRIIRAINPLSGQQVLEIGPGLAALTRPLLEILEQLTVVEIDRDVIAWLEQNLPYPGLRIHAGDALKTDLTELYPQGGPLRIVGNLPYNISSPLLFHLLKQSDRIGIRDMHFMLQKEVVDRMAASPGSKEYGRLTVMLARHCYVSPLFTVGPGAFQPAPKVHSAIVRLQPLPESPFPCGSIEQLDLIVRSAFSQRRKTLRNTLKSVLTEAQIIAADCDPTVRPEQCSPADFGRLSLQLRTA